MRRQRSRREPAGRIAEFEEQVPLSVAELGKEGYGVSIQQRIAEETGREAHLGTVYTSLDRLYRKGMVRTWVGKGDSERGGHRKRFFGVTPEGFRALREAELAREKLRKTARGLRALEAGT